MTTNNKLKEVEFRLAFSKNLIIFDSSENRRILSSKLINLMKKSIRNKKLNIKLKTIYAHKNLLVENNKKLISIKNGYEKVLGVNIEPIEYDLTELYKQNEAYFPKNKNMIVLGVGEGKTIDIHSEEDDWFKPYYVDYILGVC